MNYFPFHVGDYASHTGHLEPMEDLAYRRLLDLYYMREGPLPAGIEETAKLVRMRSMASDVEAVLREFFVLTEDGWRHKRCDAEIAKMRDKQAKARASAEASVNARKAKAEQASSTSVQRPLPSDAANAERTLPKKQTDVELPTPTPTPTPTPIYSVPYGTGASAPPPDPADVIFALGVPLLTAAGVSDRNARSMLGLQRKQHGDGAVVDALRRCAEERPLQPIPWLQAALKAKPQRNKREAIEDDNMRIAQDWARSGSAGI